MYFRRSTQSTARLKIDDRYATLKRINNDGSYTFEFSYEIDRAELVKNNATYVDITIYDRAPNSVTQQTDVTTNDLALHMQTSVTAAKMAHESKKNYVLLKRRSDVTKHINNVTASDITRIEYKRQPRLRHVGELHRNNDVRPVTRLTKVTGDTVDDNVSIRQLSLRAIRLGVDPSSIVDHGAMVLSERNGAMGTLSNNQRSVTPSVYSLYNKLASSVQASSISNTLQLDGSDQIVSYDTMPSNSVKVIDSVTFKTKREDTSNVFVVFELFDAKTGATIESITKLLYVSKHVSVYTSVLKPPTVKVSKRSSGYDANIEIVQRCNVANGIEVFKKVVSTITNDRLDYMYVGSIDMSCGDARSITVTQLHNSTSVYRFVPTCNGKKGSAYTNAVVKPAHTTFARAVVLLATPIDSKKKIGNGVQLEALHIPDDVVSAQFLQRNMSTLQKNYVPIGVPVLITEQTRASDYVSNVATDVIDGDVYEFAVKLIYRFGDEKIVSSVIHEHLVPAPNKIDVNISNTLFDYGAEPNVSFDVSLDYVDNSFEEIKTALERQGIKEYFDGDIQKQREQLKWLLAYSVKRIDMSTGDVDDMGIITSTNFSDKLVRNKRPAKKLERGKTYRYVIEVMTRAPETLFEQLKKVSVDETTRKKYVFKPSKFHHPIVFKTGTLTSPAGLRTNHAKSFLAHGLLGTSVKLDVTFGDNHVNIVSVNATPFDSSRVVVTWQTHGDASLIDHYIVLRDVNGIRELVGKVHSQDSNNKAYVHVLDRDEVGKCRYGIIPVMHDYSQGNVSMSNSVVYGMQTS